MKNKAADGLRGIAAFNVAIAHFVSAFMPSMLHRNYPTLFSGNAAPGVAFEIFSSPVFSIFYNGHFAVLIFFVLSGYVLTIPYFRDDHSSILNRRLWGRYFRLNIPIAASIGLSFVFYKLGLYSNGQAAVLSGSTHWLGNFFPAGIVNSTAFADALYGSIFFGNGTFIPQLWTLKIEFIGSLYVMLFYITKPHNNSTFPLLIAFLFLYVTHQAESIYFIAIFSGSCLNSVKINSRWTAAIFFVGFYFGAFQFESIFYDFLPQIQIAGVELWERKNFYNAIGATFLTAAVINGFGRRIFESAAFQFFGRISFSIYLLHFVVLCSLSCTLYIHLPQAPFYLAANFVSYIIACFIVSQLFETWVDKKTIVLAHRFSACLFK